MLPIQSILDKMSEISYGFVDRYGIVHKKIKRDYYMKEYRLQPPEITLKYKCGTCWDQVEVIRALLEKMDIPVETYFFDYDEKGILAKHTIAVAVIDKKYYWIESSWKNQENSIIFESIDEIISVVNKIYPQIYKIKNYNEQKLKVYKYKKPEYGIDFESFYNYCTSTH